ncbi:MAG: 50S ribosomal protein L1 [Candidatus Micrarchaeota archaeon]
MEKNKLAEVVSKALESKGSRKFTQAVELIINFKGIDFNKPDKRLNLEIALPKGTGKNTKLAVFAEGQMALDAKTAGADSILSSADITKLANDRAKLKILLKDHVLIAQPNLMMVIGKNLGQVLGTKDKLPKPIIGGNIKDIGERAKKTIKLKSKGKYLPVLQCLVGTELMSVDDLTENIEAVLEAVRAKVGEYAIRSAYVKLTMSAPQKLL